MSSIHLEILVKLTAEGYELPLEKVMEMIEAKVAEMPIITSVAVFEQSY